MDSKNLIILGGVFTLFIVIILVAYYMSKPKNTLNGTAIVPDNLTASQAYEYRLAWLNHQPTDSPTGNNSLGGVNIPTGTPGSTHTTSNVVTTKCTGNLCHK